MYQEVSERRRNELLRRPKSRQRSSCWPMIEKLLNRHGVCPASLADLLATGIFWVEGRKWRLCLLGYSMQAEQNYFPTHVISIYLTHQKFWNRETQIFRSNIWTKKICTLKFKALLIFPVCLPHSKYVNASLLSPARFLIQVQIGRKTLNIFYTNIYIGNFL